MKGQAFLFAIALVPNEVQAQGSCEQLQQQLMRQMQDTATDNGGSLCTTAKTELPVLRRAVEFYRQCRIVDPSGEMLSSAQSAKNAAEEILRNNC